MAHRRYLRRHLLTIGLLIVVAGLVAASDTLHNRTEEIIYWTEGLISQAPVLGMFVFILLAMLSAMVAFFSSALLAPIAVYTWGKTACFVLLWSGWFLGGIVSFCIGRFLGRSAVSTIIGADKVASWEGQINERAKFRHILMFQAIVPSEIPGYVLGILRYRFLLYAAALALTELPYAVATVYLGESFLNAESTVFIMLGVGTILLGTLLIRIYRSMERQGGNDPK
jgi:uncharacterized membrane protein YdjX (TVP38/TMEM64 family)